ncbi:Protein Aster-C [Tritrichomonas musculus]|uniref:Protein Aster-C n=1 Tax=Tritrichomonas musculus TaxID=1915356 RepID=A0ABR2GSJ6_9EUKA
MSKLILYVHAVEAKDVPKMDVIGKCDPFMVFRLNSKPTETWKTKDIKQTFEPHWDQVFKIPINSDNTLETLHIELFDKDDFTDDDLISTKEFQVSSFQLGKIVDAWYDFLPHKRVKKGGKVHLIFHLANENDAPFKET